MTLTETNFRSRILAYAAHADTPEDVKDYLNEQIDNRSTYFDTEIDANDRIDTYLNRSAANLDLDNTRKAVKYVFRNLDSIPD